MKPLEVTKLLSEKTATYPYQHNDRFDNKVVQNYHNHFFARIGLVADDITPKLDRV